MSKYTPQPDTHKPDDKLEKLGKFVCLPVHLLVDCLFIYQYSYYMKKTTDYEENLSLKYNLLTVSDSLYHSFLGSLG